MGRETKWDWMRNSAVVGESNGPVGGMQNERRGVDSRQGSKKAAGGGGEGVASDGAIDPFWTTYCEAADGCARRGGDFGEGGVRTVDDLVHGGRRCERNDRRAV